MKGDPVAYIFQRVSFYLRCYFLSSREAAFLSALCQLSKGLPSGV
jgi:hypothetical protein